MSIAAITAGITLWLIAIPRTTSFEEAGAVVAPGLAASHFSYSTRVVNPESMKDGGDIASGMEASGIGSIGSATNVALCSA